MYANSNFDFSQVVGPRGLVNINQSCYINSILQGLQGLKKFRELNSTFSCGGVMAQSLSTVMSNLNVDGAEAYDASEFMEAFQNCWGDFVRNTQMDAEAFWVFLFGALHDELKTEVNPPSFIDSQDNVDLQEVVINRWRSVQFRSPIGLLFHIQILTLVYCPCCNYQHGQYDDVNSHLSVPVACTIEDSFKNFCKDTHLEDGKCNACGSLGLKHRLLLGRLPPVLVVHLKRFQQNLNGSISKIQTMVEFSETLDLKPFTVEGLQSSHTYKLSGVTGHHGKSTKSGHYTTISCRGGRLYNFDDSRVTNTTARKLCSSSSYILWYELLERDGGLPLDVDVLESEVHQSSPGSQHSSHVTSLPVNDSTSDEIRENFNVLGDGDTSTSFFWNGKDDCSSSEDMFSESDADISHEISLNIQSINIAENESLHTTSFNLQESNSKLQSPSDCTHGSFDLDIMDPQLHEDEVPGAKLNMDNLDKYLKSDLERWLQCRRLLKSGSKPVLIERIQNHHKNGKSKWIFPGVDGGKWYELKRKKLMEQADSPSQRLPMMPLGVSVFKPFPSTHIPNRFSAEKVTDYLQKIPLTRFSYEEGVQSVQCEPDEEGLLDFSQPSQEDRRNIFVNGTMKRATQLLDSGRVLSVTDCERGDHYFVKSDVHASYHNRTY